MQNIWMPIGAVLNAFFAPITAAVRAAYRGLCWLLFLPLTALLAIKSVRDILHRYDHAGDCLEHLGKETIAMRETRDDLLVHDQRRAYAERLLPPAKHPTWWTNVPKHLRRSIVAHGRIRETGYAPAPLLAGGTLTPAFVEKAWSAAVLAGLRAAWLTLLFALVFAFIFGTVGGLVPAQRDGNGAETGATVRSAQLGVAEVARSYRDVFNQVDLDEVNSKLAAASAPASEHGAVWEAKTTAVVAWPLRWAMLIVAALLAALAAGRLTFIGRLRWLVRDAVEAKVANLRLPFREALQRWRYFLADRQTNDAGYADQVHFATEIDRSPLLYFGDAQGDMEFAGHILGPRQGQEMKHSIIDALQHHEVLGGTGESKSRDFYIPLLVQLLQYRKQGYPIATYVTDDKGAIVEDVRRVAKELGLEDDLLIIGTGPNEWRVDLMEAGSPVLIAEFIKSATRQAGSGPSGDDFWDEMGNDVMLNIWTLTEAAERTDGGLEWMRGNGMRLHSIKAALKLATIDDELDQVLDMVIQTLGSESPGVYARMVDTDIGVLQSAIEYLIFFWKPLTEVTRDGIRANLRKALRTFTFKPEISSGFADGVHARLLPASEMHSNRIKVLNVSQIEHGSAARMVNIMLKMMFFKQCRDVQQQNPAFTDERLQWWFDPNLAAPQKDDYYIEFFLADEYQTLVSADSSSSSGLSDATVANILRAAAVSMVCISQGIGAYEFAIGREATANIRRQWRSKHFLRTEDTATIEEAKKLVGKSMRFQVSDWQHFESTASVRRELDTDPDNLGTVQWTDAYDAIGVVGSTLQDPIHFGSWDAAFELDKRFIIDGNARDVGATAGITSQQAAFWRQEDRQSAAMQHGVLDTDALRDEQIMAMTRGRELTLLQVAGGTQVDIVRLNARAYRRFTGDQTVDANG